MKTRLIHYTTALLLAAGFAFLPAANASPKDRSSGSAGGDGQSIVGLWKVTYSEDGSPYFQSFDQWHADGLEYEVANGFGASCQGVFKQTGNTVRLFHTGWNFDATGALVGYFNETQVNVVQKSGNTYSGTWDIKNYDLNGKFVSEDSGTLTATRLTVNTAP